eukprot:202918_1
MSSESLRRTKSEDVSLSISQSLSSTVKPLKIRIPKPLKMKHAKTETRSRKSRRKRRNQNSKNKNISNSNKIPRKLGPRDIGRIKYKGTEYYDNDKSSFLKEKVHRHARSSSFGIRKSKNPIQKRPTIKQIGTPFGWKKPSFFIEADQQMKRIQLDDWLKERPMKPPDNKLDALKGTKAPKRGTVSEIGIKPKGWNEIEYKHNSELGTFLNEKLWFEGSRAPIIKNLSQMIEALPSGRKIELNVLSVNSPTGIHSKINFIKKLRDIIMEQVKLMHRQEMELKRYQSKRTLNVINKFENNKGVSVNCDGMNENKYKQLLKRRTSLLEVSRRKLFTMKSVRALDDLIIKMEKQQKSTTFGFKKCQLHDVMD